MILKLTAVSTILEMLNALVNKNKKAWPVSCPDPIPPSVPINFLSFSTVQFNKRQKSINL